MAYSTLSQLGYMFLALGSAVQTAAADHQDVSWTAKSRLKIKGHGEIVLEDFGVKYDGGRIGAGVALFSTTKPFGMLNSSSLFVDGGEQRNQGVEFSVFGEAARGVRLLGGVTLLDGKIVSDVDGSLVGKRPIGVPNSQATLGADVDIPGIAGAAISPRVIYTASQYADSSNTMAIPSWTRVDLGARYVTEINKQVVTFRARVDNLFDRNYWASTGGYPGYGYIVLGAPRTLTVSATIDF